MAFPHHKPHQEGEDSTAIATATTTNNIDIHSGGGGGATPLRYASLDRVYSAACATGGGDVGGSSKNVLSKKVKARKLMLVNRFEDSDLKKPKNSCSNSKKPPILHVYSRSAKRPRHSSFFDSLLARGEADSNCRAEDDDLRVLKKRRRFGSSELVKLGVDSSVLHSFDGPRLRDCRSNKINTGISNTKTKKSDCKRTSSVSSTTAKRWLR